MISAANTCFRIFRKGISLAESTIAIAMSSEV